MLYIVLSKILWRKKKNTFYKDEKEKIYRDKNEKNKLNYKDKNIFKSFLDDFIRLNIFEYLTKLFISQLLIILSYW